MRKKWAYRKIGDVLEVARGGSPRPIQKYLTEEDDGINWIKISDATASGKFIYSTEQKITKEGLKKTRIVEEGDFILSNSMSFGRPYIMKTRGCVHDGWLILKNKESVELSQDYLYYLLGSPLIFEQFDSLAAGSTVRNLNIKLVSSVTIPIPPLPEQKQIVAILDKAFAAIDQAKANIERNIKNAQELFQSKLNEIFSHPTSGSGGDGWEEKKFKDLVELKSGTTFAKDIERPEGEVPYLKIADMNIEGNEELIITSSRFVNHKDIKQINIIPPGAIIFPKRGGAIATNKKRLTVIPICIDLNTMSAIPKDGIRSKYLYFFFLSFDLSEISNGTTIQQINNYSFDELSLTIPSIEKQDILIHTLGKYRNDINLLSEVYKKKLNYLEELKKSILQKAFAGELTNLSASGFSGLADDQDLSIAAEEAGEYGRNP